METLGQFLQEKRKGKGLRLEDIASRTRINLNYLEALETDQFDKFSSEVIARGFARSYGFAMGLEEKEILDRFDESAKTLFKQREEDRHSSDQRKHKIKKREAIQGFLGRFNAVLVVGLALGLLYWINSNRIDPLPPQSTVPPAVVEIPEPDGVEITQEPLISPVVVGKGPAINRPVLPGSSLPPVAAIPDKGEIRQFPVSNLSPGALEEALHRNPSLPNEPQKEVIVTDRSDPLEKFRVNKPTVKDPPVVSPPSLPVDADKKPEMEARDTGSITLSIEATEPSWVAAQIDDTITKEVFLEPGEKVRWIATERFLLSLGNAGGVKIELNGKPLKPFGPRGAVIKDIPLTHDYSQNSVLPM